MTINPEEIKRVLVVNLGGMGDNLLSIPALRALRPLYPKAYIAVLTLSRSREVLSGRDFINEIVVSDLDYKGPGALGGLTRWKSFYGLLMNLRKDNFDMIINMRTLVSPWSSIKMALIFFLIGAKYNVGRDTMGRGFFLNVKIPESYPGRKHDMEYDLDIVRSLGASTENARLEFDISKRDAEFADNLLRSRGIRPGDIIAGISPGALFPSRRWPLENFIEVGKTLLDAGYKVIIMGTRDEGYFKDEFEKSARGSDFISIVGETNMRQFAALIKRCAVYLVNDTGAMHMAASTSVNMIAIIGPGDIENYDPRKVSANAAVFYKKTVCSPCEKIFCSSLECLRVIKPQEVADKCLEMLRRIGR